MFKVPHLQLAESEYRTGLTTKVVATVLSSLWWCLCALRSPSQLLFCSGTHVTLHPRLRQVMLPVNFLRTLRLLRSSFSFALHIILVSLRLISYKLEGSRPYCLILSKQKFRGEASPRLAWWIGAKLRLTERPLDSQSSTFTVPGLF